MRKALPLVTLAVVALSLASPIVRGEQPQPDFVPEELLVEFTPGVLQNQKNGILGSQAMGIVRSFDTLGIDLVKLPPGRAVAAAMAALAGRPGIRGLQPNYRRSAVATGQPNDPFWLNNSLWGLQTISAAGVWAAYTTGDANVIVADIDTGVDYNHPDLAANMWHNPGEIPGNGIDDDQNGYADDVFGIDTINHDSNPMDDHSHGTHTAGTIAAVGNNNVGVVGVGWNTKILACKFLNASASGTDAGAIECFNYLVALKQKGINIRVTNNSWGGARGGGVATQLKNAIDAAGAAGMLNVFAAGNAGTNNDTTPFDPASFTSSSIISVAASDPANARASFSNYGATSVDLAAPGTNILSTVPGGYGGKSGTSMATPHVAGVAALLLALDGTRSVDALKTLILSSVDVLPSWAGVVASGGRLNALTAASAIGTPGLTNVALSATGGVASASSTYSGAHPASAANDGDRRGVSSGNGGWWNDATANAFPDWLQVQFSGSKTISEIDVYSVQDNYQSPIDPTPSMTFTLYGLTAFDVQYWTGNAWQTVPGGSISGNNLVRRQITFAPLTTDRVRVLVNSALNTWSRIPEVEVFGTSGGPSNAPPAVTLTGPADGSTFTAPATVNLTATASDNDGAIARVDFMAGTTVLFSDFASPYAFTWTNVPAGPYTLTAVAVDDDQATTTSAASTITVSPASGGGGGTNVALAANGGVASASSVHSSGYAPAGAINGDRRGQPWGGGAGWNDGTPNTFPDSLQVQFNGTKTIAEVDVFSVQDNYQAPADPTPSMTFTQYGLTSFDVQYWTGTAWQTVPGGAISGNNLVWRKVTFAPIATDRVRILVNAALNNWSRIAEVEVYTTGGAANAPPTVTLTGPADGSTFTAPATVNLTATAGDSDGAIARVDFFAGTTLLFSDFATPYAFTWTGVVAGNYALTAVAVDDDEASTTSTASNITVNPAGGGGTPSNVALAANGGIASASTVHSSGYAPAGAINGDRRGTPWGFGAGWNDATPNGFPDWLEVQFSGPKSISEVDVFSVQDNYASPVVPTQSMTFTLYGLTTFDVQYWTDGAWQTVPGGAIAGNNLVWRQVTFAPVTTDRVRILVHNALGTWSRIAEVEVYGIAAAPEPEAILAAADDRSREPDVRSAPPAVAPARRVRARRR